MTVFLVEKGLNSQERGQGVAVFQMGAIASVGKRLEEDTMYADGDILLLGHLPKDSLTTDIRLFVGFGFKADVTLDIGFASYNSEGNITGIVPFAPNVSVNVSNTTVVVPMPLSGVLNPDKTPYSGDRGSLNSIGGKTPIVVRINAPTGLAPTAFDKLAEVTALFTYSYIASNQTGGYIG